MDQNWTDISVMFSLHATWSTHCWQSVAPLVWRCWPGGRSRPGSAARRPATSLGQRHAGSSSPETWSNPPHTAAHLRQRHQRVTLNAETLSALSSPLPKYVWLFRLAIHPQPELHTGRSHEKGPFSTSLLQRGLWGADKALDVVSVSHSKWKCIGTARAEVSYVSFISPNQRDSPSKWHTPDQCFIFSFQISTSLIFLFYTTSES